MQQPMWGSMSVDLLFFCHSHENITPHSTTITTEYTRPPYTFMVRDNMCSVCVYYIHRRAIGTYVLMPLYGIEAIIAITAVVIPHPDLPSLIGKSLKYIKGFFVLALSERLTTSIARITGSDRRVCVPGCQCRRIFRKTIKLFDKQTINKSALDGTLVSTSIQWIVFCVAHF